MEHHGVGRASAFTPTASTSTTSTRARASRSCCCTAALVSTNPIWAGVPVAYASHMDTLAEHFRVIAPGHARLRQDRAHRAGRSASTCSPTTSPP